MEPAIQENVPLAPYTTFKIGGNARYFAVVRSVEHLRKMLTWRDKKGCNLFVLGGGSNVLISDAGVDGLVIKIDMKGISFEESSDQMVATVSAGEIWDTFVEKTIKEGLWGVENLSGIPGTVGAAPIQNIGAYGQEVADTIIWVEAIDQRTAELKRFSNEECEFSYRDSFFKTSEGKKYIITRVAFRLEKEGEPNLSYKDLQKYFSSRKDATLSDTREAVLKIRSGKFPNLKAVGTAGSFFKNPIISKEKFEALQETYPELPGYQLGEKKVKIPCAWILDHVFDVKGVCENGVGFFKKQPLVVINLSGGTAQDIQNLTQPIVDRFKKELGIDLEREVTLVGKK